MCGFVPDLSCIYLVHYYIVIISTNVSWLLCPNSFHVNSMLFSAISEQQIPSLSSLHFLSDLFLLHQPYAPSVILSLCWLSSILLFNHFFDSFISLFSHPWLTFFHLFKLSLTLYNLLISVFNFTCDFINFHFWHQYLTPDIYSLHSF